MCKLVTCLAVAASLTASFVANTGTATADPYKWCAQYADKDDGSLVKKVNIGGAVNCGFVTLEQCRATLSGMGGFCFVNPFYTEPSHRPTKRQRR